MDRDIEGTITQLCVNLTLMIHDLDSGSYTPRPLPIDKLKNLTRESYQEVFRGQALVIIRKLKFNEPLTSEEAKLTEEWMVGDIELYQIIEDHYKDWKEKILELSNQLKVCDYSGVNSDVKCLLNIQAVLFELEHVLRDIDQYRYALDRIKRFRTFVGQDINAMARDEKAKLADHMRSMVYSDRE
jgi:hypothetical protein